MPATLQSKEMQSLESIAEGSNKFAIDLYKVCFEQQYFLCKYIRVYKLLTII